MIFSPKARHTLAFSYKQSLAPCSRDHYSYRGVDLNIPQVNDAEIATWLAFISSGVNPEEHPAQLRRALLFEIAK
jgi:hypothetical protein